MTSGVQAVTLTDFLLARIAEDEEAVNARTRYLSPGGWSYVEQFGDFGDDERWMIEIPAARVLAECEAKRRIVAAESASRVVEAGDATVTHWSNGVTVVDGLRMSDAEFRERFTRPGPPSKTLHLLALPFADHPDYREEWRV